MSEQLPNSAAEAAISPAVGSKSARGAVGTFAAQLAKLVVQFGTQVALARLLEPSAFGLVAMATPLIGFINIFTDLGLSQAIIQRREISHAQLNTLFWVNVGFAVILACGVAALAPLAAMFYGEPRVAGILISLSGLLLASGLSMQHMALLSRNLQFGTLAIIDIAGPVVASIVGIAAAWMGMGYWSLVLMQVANTATLMILAWVFDAWRPSWPRWEPGTPGMLRMGGHLTGANLAQYFSNASAGVLIGKVHGEVALGLYDRGAKLVALPLMQIFLPVDRIAIPTLSRLIENPPKYREAYVTMVQLLLLVGTPGFLFVALNATPLAVWVLGPAWAGTGPITAAMSCSALATTTFVSSYWLFVSQGRTGEQLRYGSAAALLNVVSFVAGLPWGAPGVAAASAICFVFIQTPLLCGAATRSGPVRRADLLAALVPFVISGAAAALVGYTTQPRLAGLGSTGLLAMLPLLYGTFCAVLACLPAGRRLYGTLWHIRSILKPA